MYTTLRMIHVIFGLFLGGTYLFLVPILEPRLKRLGPTIQSSVMRSLMPIMTPVMGASFIVVIGTGIAMTLMLREGALDTILTSAWGWDIIIGFVATIASSIVGFGMITPTGIRLDRLGRSVEGRAPSPDEGQQLHHLSERVERLSRINFVFVVIAIATMVIARYL